jgi:hypothetical protein
MITIFIGELHGVVNCFNIETNRITNINLVGDSVSESISETCIFLTDVSIKNPLVIFTNGFGDIYW